MPRSDRFLGTGWRFPPTFERLNRSVRMVSGLEDIRESLFILLSTIPGERVMLPNYGCDLHRFVFRTVTTTLIEEIKDVVSTAVHLWEKRIDLLACDVRQDVERPGLILIELSYLVRRSNQKGNFVFPFYLDEAAAAEKS
jgi:hypothetical protein